MSEIFVGRDEELAVLDASLERAAAGSGRLVLLSGEPGIGKTRLAEELCRIATARDASASWGRSWEGPGTPAYWPWLQVLRTLPANPELGPMLDGATSVGDHHEARFRLFDAIAQHLSTQSRRRPLVIVLDDMHAADVSTLLLLHFVSRNLRTSRVLVIATSRDSWFHATPETSELLAKIAREALHVPLGRLGLDDITRWMTELAPHLASTASKVFDSSEGNPLFVGELVAAARKRPTDAAWPPQMPDGVREAVRAHLALLSVGAARVLEAASVHGRELPALDRAIVDEARSLGVVDETQDRRLRFAHVMLRDELYARLSPERRGELHLAAARLASDPMTAAHHHLLAAHAEVADALAAVLLAMTDARARLAFEDAAGLGERAIAALGPRLARREASELRIAVAEAAMLAGRKDEGFEQCLRASELADDAELVARAAIVATSVIRLGRNEALVQLLRRALDGLPPGDSALRANVMAWLALAMIPPSPDDAEAAAELRVESVAMARRVGDDAALFTGLRLASHVFPETSPVADRLANNREVIAMAERLGQVAHVAPMLASQVHCLLETGDLDAALREAATIDRRLSAFREPMYKWRAPLIHATLAGLTGRFAEADAFTREALHVAREHDQLEALLMFTVARTALQYNRADAVGLEEFAALILSTQTVGGSGPYVAIFHAAGYDVEQTRAWLDRTVALPIEAMPGSAAFAWAAVRVELVEHARRLYAVGRHHFARVSLHFSPTGCMGPSALLLGQLAAAARDERTAEAYYRDALALAEQLRARPYMAQTRLAWAKLLGRGDDARRHADAAHAIADELGMDRVAQAAAAICGAPTPKRAAPAKPPAPRPELTIARRGELWQLSGGKRELLLKDSKGLAYLEMLVRDREREIHVLDLVGIDSEGDAGPQLDAAAKDSYRRRAEEVRGVLETALANNDLGHAERARAELELLGDELARAVGLGGRDRRAASQAERARINVQRRLRDVIRRVEEQDPDLARHLELSLKTGLFCSYVPGWPQPRA